MLSRDSVEGFRYSLFPAWPIGADPIRSAIGAAVFMGLLALQSSVMAQTVVGNQDTGAPPGTPINLSDPVSVTINETDPATTTVLIRIPDGFLVDSPILNINSGSTQANWSQLSVNGLGASATVGGAGHGGTVTAIHSPTGGGGATFNAVDGGVLTVSNSTVSSPANAGGASFYTFCSINCDVTQIHFGPNNVAVIRGIGWGVLAGPGAVQALGGAEIVPLFVGETGARLVGAVVGTLNLAPGTALSNSINSDNVSGVYSAFGGTTNLGEGSSILLGGASGLRGVVADGAPAGGNRSSVNGQNLAITVDGPSSIGAQALQGGLVNLSNGRTVSATGAGAVAGQASGVGEAPAATPSLLKSSGTNFAASGDGAIALSMADGGQIEMTGGSATAQGAGSTGLHSTNAADVPNTATLTNATIASPEGASISMRGGPAVINLVNSVLTANNGVWLDTAASAGGRASDLNLTATATQISGAATTAAGNTAAVTLAQGASWTVTGNSNLTTLTNNASQIQFAAPSADPSLPASYKTLRTVNYNGAGGTIGLNTFLGADGSPSDKLVVDGGTAQGSTALRVSNTGGAGAVTQLNGIQVVDAVNGGTTAAGAFSLSGRVVAGPYEYMLFRGSADASNAQAWYLRSENPVQPPAPPAAEAPVPPPATPAPAAAPAAPLYRPEVGAYLSNQRQAGGMFVHSLHDRLGEPQWIESQGDGSSEKPSRSGWLRIVGKDGKSTSRDGNFSVDTDSTLIQGGGDVARWSVGGDAGRLHLGGMLGYGKADSDATASGNPARAKGTAEGWSGGLYGTWYQNDAQKLGWYADVWGLYGWFNNKVQGDGLPEVRYDAKAYTLSGETGYAMKAGNSNWVVEPQAQLLYVHYSGDDVVEPNGTRVDGGDGSGWISRLGVRVHRTWVSDTGRRMQPYLTLNWWHDATDNSVAFNQALLENLYPSNRYEVKLGMNGDLGKGWTAWGNLGYLWGSQDYRNTTVRLGAKYTW